MYSENILIYYIMVANNNVVLRGLLDRKISEERLQSKATNQKTKHKQNRKQNKNDKHMPGKR